MNSLRKANDCAPAAGTAVAGAGRSLDAAALEERIAQLAAALQDANPRTHVLGLMADNGPDWLIVDLACERIGLPIVPLPAFFTAGQMQHAVDSTGMDALLCAVPPAAQALGFAPAAPLPGTSLPWFRRSARPTPLPAGSSKITFTSGTTGHPKGVCLSSQHQRLVASSLVHATRDLGIERHLSLLPLAVLLENVAGVYAPLMAGATCCLPPLAEVGVGGSSSFNPITCLEAIAKWQAHSVIVLPQMLLALTAALEAGAPRPAQLRFVAVGGAKVAPALIARARAVGLPAYEGYGLSECASVVALNVPGADRPGTVGQPLPHVRVSVDGSRQLVVEGSTFLGYLGVPANRDAPLHTGDLGRIDADRFLTIDGRRKHQLITAFGRNVAPEWPEAELAASPLIAQSAVFGEAKPRLCAVIVPSAQVRGDAEVEAAVASANLRLPDYAQIASWIRADAPFSVTDGTATANGRVVRDAVWAQYAVRLESTYQDSTVTNALL
ncbi:MAG: AMP-binding protein [Burkholderiaceae bacterium]